MKGKKSDSEFVSNFITNCISEGINSSDDILKTAITKINQIDNKIKEVEKLKVIRSKLLDVVSTFDKPQKNIKKEEVKILSLFKIQNNHICQLICDSVKIKAFKLEDICNEKYPLQDIIFCIKQLLEVKVIAKTGDYFVCGEMYNEYVKYVLRGE